MDFMGVLGMVFMLGVAVLLSTSRRSIRWSLIFWGLGLQFVFALLILKTDAGRALFAFLNDVVIGILGATQVGAEFVFGNLARYAFTPVPVTGGEGAVMIAAGFAFVVLPTVIFFSSLMAILYHLNIMQQLVKGVAFVVAKTMRTSGPETLSVSANIFVGQTESPLVIRPFLKKLSDSELMAVMTGGFATIAGGVMAAYVFMLKDQVPNIAGHLIAASVMSAPAALMMAKLFVPDRAPGMALAEVKDCMQRVDTSAVDAAARGATEGLQLAFNIAAMLIAFLALMQLVNIVLGALGGLIFDFPELSLAWLLGRALAPFAFLLGAPWSEAAALGDLLGTKIFLNEFVAYAKIGEMAAAGVSEKTLIIATYALCGFANVGSIGIQIGGLSALAPERRKDLARLAPRAMVAGAFASFTTACVASMLL